MLGFAHKVSEIFRFRKTSLSLFVILSYSVVIFLDFFANYKSLVPPFPEPKELTSAWSDLQAISRKPHPFTSRENDEVHSYLSSRVVNLAENSRNIEVAIEKGSPALFKQRDVFNDSSLDNRVVYYESSNVMVRVKGRDADKKAVLISAHFDTVPTASGPTDDGMGIASMMGILQKISDEKCQFERDIIFNFNNNEEFGLLGATSFFHHKWSEKVEYFVNLEGTGAGGRSILFRASDVDAARFYRSAPMPFASSVFQEGFSRRIISSETDYKVYVQNGLKGLDIAFYKPRSLYHTYRDSILTTDKGSLYHMMANAMAVLEAMANSEEEAKSSASVEKLPQAVFFDILGTWFVVFSIDTLYVFNVILSVSVPVVITVLLIIVFSRNTWQVTRSKLSSVLRLPASIVFAIIGTKWAVDYIKAMNPMVASLNYNVIMAVAFSVFVLINYAVLVSFNGLFKIHDQKLMVMLQMTAFFWLWNVISTIRESPGSDITGEWLSTLLLITFGFNTILGLFIMACKTHKREKRIVLVADAVDSDSADADSAEEEQEEGDDSSEESEDALSETTPLLVTNVPPPFKVSFNSPTYDWSLQFILLVPVSLYFLYLNIHEILQACYNNTHYSDKDVNSFYVYVAASGIAMALPLLPFVNKLNYVIRLALILTVAFGMAFAANVFPFTYDNPLKVSFFQNIDLAADPSSTKMYVSGRNGYLQSALEDLPSVKSSKSGVVCDSQSTGMEICHFEAEGPALIDYQNKNDYSDMIEFDVIKNTHTEGSSSPYEPFEAELKLKVKGNRNCLLTFNSSTYSSFEYGVSPVRAVTIYHSDSNFSRSSIEYAKLPSGYSRDREGNDHYKIGHGIDSLLLHKYDWEQPSYHIGVQWLPRWDDDADAEDSGLGLQLSCYYGEYEGVKKVKSEEEAVRIMPAYDEMMTYSPNWLIYTKWYPGLVRIGNKLDL